MEGEAGEGDLRESQNVEDGAKAHGGTVAVGLVKRWVAEAWLPVVVEDRVGHEEDGSTITVKAQMNDALCGKQPIAS